MSRSLWTGGTSTVKKRSSPGWLKSKSNAQPDERLLPTSPEPVAPDVARMVEVLDRRSVDYLVVGGVATQAYGANRPTGDFDCLVRQTAENFERLAIAMRELNARLRVHGLTDTEAAELPVQLDALTLSRTEISTWMTDAGALDILIDMPDRQGRRVGYEGLAGDSRHLAVEGVQVRVAGLAAIIASKEWAARPKDHEALDELYRLRDRPVGDS